MAPIWRRAWNTVIPFFAFPPAGRRMIDTINAVASLNRSPRKVIKNRFPADKAALKLLFLAIRNAAVRWNPDRGWTEALPQVAILLVAALLVAAILVADSGGSARCPARTAMNPLPQTS